MEIPQQTPRQTQIQIPAGTPERPTTEGVLEVMASGYGLLRTGRHWLPGAADVYVSPAQIRRLELRSGDHLMGEVQPPAAKQQFPTLSRVETVNGGEVDAARGRPRFDDLTAIFPTAKFDLELTERAAGGAAQGLALGNRLVDLFVPVGKGQRGLVVSPPKAGKTTVLKGLAYGITRNHPECAVLVALIGERPEEVTDWERTVPGVTVVAATFDQAPEHQARVAELCIERAKRLVELGQDVVVFMDSITRLTRAYNLVLPGSGRTLSGGLDLAAVYPPKHLLGAARNVEEGGSLTIFASCLVETESRQDDLIYEEFRGTGNMELRLDRRLQEKRIFPAIDVPASSTRREELLHDAYTLKRVAALRRALAAAGKTEDVLQAILAQLARTGSNREFLATLDKGFVA
ncbi:MAG TPA: transcription termination factor Rho [Chloroflexota bacterium]|nr:transcription termination factor Rho [Chloroflexota bacterium]